MKKLLLLTIVLASLLSCAQEKNTGDVTVYYFIRHAEKDRSNPQLTDPHLTEKGKERAQKWATVFGQVNFDAVYSTDYSRTLQTARPTATRQQLDIISYDPKTLHIEEFKRDTRGKTVLVVGHSNTTPMLVNALLGRKKYADIEDNNNANLYIVTVTPNSISDMVLKID